MARIFISYRRDDAAGHAGRLYDQLREDFGGEHVFMDVDAIEPGVDFVERIESAVAAADVFLAVLGRSWASVTDADGHRRLDDPDDFVRREVSAALRRRMTVIPVLVGGAEMPPAHELPEELVPLTRRNALLVSDLDWHGGVRRLSAVLEKALGTKRPPPKRRRDEHERRREEPYAAPASLLAGLAGAALLVAGTALRWEEIVRPAFGGGHVPGLGLAVAPASLAVAAGAVYALLRSWHRGPGATEVGLLLGFAAAGLIKYAALLGRFQTTPDRVSDGPAQWGSQLSLLLGLAGSLVLAAVAAYWIVAWHRREARFARVPGRVLATAGAILMLAGTALPFNVVRPETDAVERVLLRIGLWEAFDPVVLAVAVVLTVLLAGRMATLTASGVLIALGIAGTLLWLRYVGVPVLQMLQQENLASVRAGGPVGMAGALLVWRAGIVSGRSAADTEPAPAEHAVPSP